MSLILAAFTAFVVKNAPSWLASLNDTILGKSQEFAVDKGNELVVGKGKQLVKHLFHLDEKEQLRHLEQALKNATERGLATFQTLPEQKLYEDILRNLSQKGEQGEALRHEIMQFFTLAKNPNLTKLNDIYNEYQRLQDANHRYIDVTPYLNSFFSALIGELYADPYFRPQLSGVLQQRASASMQRSLLEVVDVLKNIDARLGNSYSAEDFARDVAIYTEHIERTQHNLKIIGIVSEDRIADPEIGGIFVPLRIALKDQRTFSGQSLDTVVAALEQFPCLVLLGGPGSGKSTATKHLAWSHAAADRLPSALAQTLLLSGNPLPLHIELHRLNEERMRANYDFLSFATEVLLKREGITINPQMFKELLTRRCLLLLFDGLDEVSTLSERLELVKEIENFTVTYPGNRVLVTSRPVGYDLSPISHPLFAHAEVQNFDDQQIQQFLHNWYTAVLRLSPIPQREQEELGFLLTTLKENPRLHKLAENPLLLTVITQIHRYERLPDRRVLVYDRCADLLLEGWAEHRGTGKRWKDMRMVKDDQRACVAYLGFVLHERSQEQLSASSTKIEERETDISSRFLSQCVEEFLKERGLIVSVAEQRSEARRFISLVQKEAGLIVMRGTDENGEPLYSFVHRTFQEYFAAADVLERYQQEENSAVVSKFLCDCLHDPHWHEVILLLLGKLKSRPVTKQLKELLEGKTKSKRSCYTDIVQQDLFFVCNCLIEEITVENSLIEMVISRLCDVVRDGWFPSQQRVALEYLGKLMNTRQGIGRGKKELVEFATKNNGLGEEIGLYAIQILYLYSPSLSEERYLAANILQKLAESADLSVEQVRKTAESLCRNGGKGSGDQQLARAILRKLLERSDLSVEQGRKTAESLYRNSRPGSDTRQQAMTILTNLVERSDLSVEQLQETVVSLSSNIRKGSDSEQLALTILRKLVERTDLSVEQMQEMVESLYRKGEDPEQLARTILRKLVERTDLSVEQKWKTALLLYRNSGKVLDARQQAMTILTKLVEGADLSLEQIRETVESLGFSTRQWLDIEQIATKVLMKLMERTDLSVEQIREMVLFFYERVSDGSEVEQLALTILRECAEKADFSMEQVRGTVSSLYGKGFWGPSEGRQLALMMLRKWLEKADLSAEQMREMAEFLSPNSLWGSSESRQLALTMLRKCMERADLSADQTPEMALRLYMKSSKGSDTEQLALTTLRKCMENPGLSVEWVLEAAESLYRSSLGRSGARQLARMTLKRLVERSDLSVEQRWKTAEFLYSISSKGSSTQQQVITILTELVERKDLSVEQILETAESLYRNSRDGSDTWQLAKTILTKLVKRTDLSVEQIRKTAGSLYRRSDWGSSTQQQAKTILVKLMKRSDLPVEQRWKTAELIYSNSLKGSSIQEQAKTILMKLMEKPDLSVEQILETVLSFYHNSYQGLDAEQLAKTILTKLVERSDLSVEQIRKTADFLRRSSLKGSDAVQLALTILRKLVERSDLSTEEMWKTAELLYQSNLKGAGVEQLVLMMLTKLVERFDLPVEQIRETVETFYINSPEGSDERLLATSAMLTLLSHADKSEIKDDMYERLRSMVPQFHKLALVETH